MVFLFLVCFWFCFALWLLGVSHLKNGIAFSFVLLGEVARKKRPVNYPQRTGSGVKAGIL
jgi:hypothetical protein